MFTSADAGGRSIATTNLGHVANAGDRTGGALDAFDDPGLYSIESSKQHMARRPPDDQQDRRGDSESDQRVCDRVPEPRSERAEEHREARPSVGPRVVAVGDKGGTADFPSGADAKDGHRLVAEKAERRSSRDRTEIFERPRMEQTFDRLIGGHHGARENDPDHGEASEIFNATEPVREALGGLPPSDRKGNSERNCRGCVTEVVDGVGEQRHAARQEDDGELDERGRKEKEKRPFHGAKTLLARRDCGIHDPVRVALVLVMPVGVAGMVVIVMRVIVKGGFLAHRGLLLKRGFVGIGGMSII